MLGSPMIDALVLSLSNIVICSVAAVLYVAVNEFEPNRRLAFCAKDRNRRGWCRGTPRSFDAMTGVGAHAVLDALHRQPLQAQRPHIRKPQACASPAP